eukprot:COSAG01_NODE_72840_length_252_cov_0.418301_1_plen_43_part_01
MHCVAVRTPFVQDLLAYMRRITSGKSTETVEGEWFFQAEDGIL